MLYCTVVQFAAVRNVLYWLVSFSSCLNSSKRLPQKEKSMAREETGTWTWFPSSFLLEVCSMTQVCVFLSGQFVSTSIDTNAVSAIYRCQDVYIWARFFKARDYANPGLMEFFLSNVFFFSFFSLCVCVCVCVWGGGGGGEGEGGIKMVIGWICSCDFFETSWKALHEVLPIFIAEEAECLNVCAFIASVALLS